MLFIIHNKSTISTVTTELKLDETDIENDLVNIVKEMHYERHSGIKFQSLFINVYKTEEIKLKLPTFENFTLERTKTVIYIRTLHIY